MQQTRITVNVLKLYLVKKHPTRIEEAGASYNELELYFNSDKTWYRRIKNNRVGDLF